MSRRFARLGSLVLPLVVVLAACDRDDPGDVSADEQALASTSQEDVVTTVETAWECATAESDGLTALTITFADCAGPLGAAGTIRFELASDSTLAVAVYDVTVAVTVRQMRIDGGGRLSVPIDPSQPRVWDGLWTVVGPSGRPLSVDGEASWVKSGSCVTLDASGSVTGPQGGSASFQIVSKTLCP